jgi:6-phosphogluconolactonase
MKKLNLFTYLTLVIIMLLSSCNNESTRLFVGKYAKTGEKGLYTYDMNLKKGTFSLLSESDAGPNPSYFCISKKNGKIYVANEVRKFNDIKGGGLTTLQYNANGVMEKLNEIAVPNGGPCFISLSHNEDFLFMANYSGGSIAVIKLDNEGIPQGISDTIFYKGEEGTVSHAHMVGTDPAGERVYLTDLGLDRIVIFDLNSESGRLQQIPNGIVEFQKGAGPRHFVFSSNGKRMYVINELNSTISVFNVETNGELKPIQTVTTLTEGFEGKSYCADIHIGKDGEYIYGSNRGENTIVTFSIGSDGKLTLAGHTSCGGDWPRNFVIDPSGEFLLVGNQRSGNISLYSIDKDTGLPIMMSDDNKITSPACLKFFDNN